MTTSLRATEGHVIVTLIKPEEFTSTGLYIPETHRKNGDRAVVVSTAGQDGIKVGDTVLLSGEWAGSNVEHDGVKYVVVVTEEILAVLE